MTFSSCFSHPTRSLFHNSSNTVAQQCLKFIQIIFPNPSGLERLNLLIYTAALIFQVTLKTLSLSSQVCETAGPSLAWTLHSLPGRILNSLVTGA